MGPSSRTFPVPALLAALAGVAAVVSLLLPWFASDTAVLAEAVGYQVFHPATVLAQALGGLAALWVALRIFGGDEAPTHSGTLLLAAVAIAGRPVYALVKMPGSEGASGSVGAAAPVMTAAFGLYLALAAAGLLVVAVVVAAFRGSAAKSNAWNPAPGGVPGSAHVPMGLTGNASAPQAYTTPSQPSQYPPGPSPVAPVGAFAPAAPVAYQSAGAYGAEGPSTLDRDSRLVRPNDPLAPKPREAPAVPIMPAPVEVTPLHDPAPVQDAPGAVYGVPRPETPPAGAPQRSGSTAPPGF